MPEELSSPELIRRSLAGDVDAFEALLSRYQERIYVIAYSVVHNHADADDIVGAVLCKVYEKLDEFDSRRAGFSTWLYRITVNLAIDHLRREERRRVAYAAERSRPERKGASDPAQAASDHELRTRVEEAIDELPPQQRLITVLHELQGLRNDEIAEILDSTPGNVRVQLYHSRKKLSEKIRDLTRGEAPD